MTQLCFMAVFYESAHHASYYWVDFVKKSSFYQKNCHIVTHRIHLWCVCFHFIERLGKRRITELPNLICDPRNIIKLIKTTKARGIKTNRVMETNPSHRELSYFSTLEASCWEGVCSLCQNVQHLIQIQRQTSWKNIR